MFPGGFLELVEERSARSLPRREGEKITGHFGQRGMGGPGGRRERGAGGLAGTLPLSVLPWGCIAALQPLLGVSRSGSSCPRLRVVSPRVSCVVTKSEILSGSRSSAAGCLAAGWLWGCPGTGGAVGLGAPCHFCLGRPGGILLLLALSPPLRSHLGV